ncbi:IPT/TIG domain-containing protein, partial [Streptomyces sp. F63]|uniref:IPT/TIG domain-containing protein n=1 Tax=Streptomyces sp. F63 TaxID=2824887 RepID=UPI001B392D18
GFVPVAGPPAGGTTVEITGTDFVNVSDVTVAGVPVTSFIVNDPTSITAVTAAAPAGTTGPVSVTTPSGTGSSTGSFTYVAVPAVTGFVPTSGSPLGGTSVEITGTDFTNVTAVTIAGQPVASYTVNSPTSITAVTTAAAAGTTGPVAVTTLSGTGTSSASFTYLAAPAVTGFVPVAGPPAGGTTVEITGTDFVNVSDVTVAGVPVASFIVNDPTSITAVTAAAPAGTTGPVSVTTPSGTGSSTGSFTYVAVPAVTGFVPTSGSPLGGTSVEITGTDFTNVTGVTVAGQPVASFTVNSPTSITAVTTAAPAGTTGPVAVTTLSGTGTSTASFTYVAAPTVSGFAPAAGPVGGGTTVAITGTDFVNVESVVIAGEEAASFTVNSPTSITAVTSPGTAGASGPVTVTTASGSGSSAASFTYVAAPAVTGFVPTSGTTAGGTVVSITGTDFTDVQSVSIGGVPVASFTVNSPTSITAVTAPGALGASGPVTVTTLYGTGSSTAVFTYVTEQSTTTVTVETVPAYCGDDVVIIATVTSPSGPVTTGTLTFLVTENGPIQVLTPNAAGQATATFPDLPVGLHHVVVVYEPADDAYLSSASPVTPFTVSKAPSTTTVVAVPNPAGPTESVTLTATVAGPAGHPSTPTGTVTFSAPGLGVLGTAELVGGQAQISTSDLPAGTTTVVTADYEGDGCFDTSSGTVSVTITPVAPTTLTATPATIRLRANGTLLIRNVSATLTSGGTPVPGQTITFTANTTSGPYVLGTAVTDAAGTATLPDTPVPNSVITATTYQAVFAGTPVYTGSTATGSIAFQPFPLLP